jgi:hypothetical protein
MTAKWTHIDTNERTVQAGPGRLGGLILSHGESAPQTVTLYDGVSAAGGRVIARLVVAPESCPAWFYFEPEMAFSTGLVIEPGNCQVQALCYG